MESVLLVIHLMVALAIIIIVLIQPSESGGFVGGGNMSGMTKPRRGGDTLTRLTMIFAGIFFMTSISLAIFARHTAPETDILKLAAEASATQTTEAPAKETKVEKKEVKSEAPKDTKPKAPISK